MKLQQTTGAVTLYLLSINVVQAQIVLDGTLGSSGPLSGPDYQILAELGQQAGNNLFHSFFSFNLASGESATFTASDSIANIVGRVTGGDPSVIHGTIEVSGTADLWLINPDGFLFGEGAQLELSGSFYTSTADALQFSDGGSFNARQPQDTVLSSDSPSAFGFLDGAHGSITVNSTNLSVPPGETLALIGNDIIVDNATLSAPGGVLYTISTASAGLVDLTADGLNSLANDGDIVITNNSQLSASSDSAGEIFIIGGQIEMNDSGIINRTVDGDSGDINVRADTLSLRASSSIATDSVTTGRAGDIKITTNNLDISGGGGINSFAFNQGDSGNIEVIAYQDITLRDRGLIASISRSDGNAGDVRIEASRISIDGEVTENNSDGILDQLTGIGSLAFGRNGNAGQVNVNATDSIGLINGGLISSSTLTFGSGSASDVSVTTGELIIDGFSNAEFPGLLRLQSNITSNVLPGSTGNGNGGNVTVEANTITVSNSGAIASDTFGLGDAGLVTVTADRISIITDLAFEDPVATGISSSTHDAGNAGNVLVNAGEILIRGGPTLGLTGIGSIGFPGSTGSAGKTEVIADRIEINDGGAISGGTSGSGNADEVVVQADEIIISGQSAFRICNVCDDDFEFMPSLIGSPAFSSDIFSGFEVGEGGSVTVTADTIRISDGGMITARSLSDEDAGDILINASHLQLDNSSIGTESREAGGGNIDINVQDFLVLTGDSTIKTSVKSGSRDAGNITIAKPEFLVLLDDSLIEANSTSTDPDSDAGNIDISTNSLILQRDQQQAIRADAEEGVDGDIQLNTPNLNISDKLVILPSDFFSPINLLDEPCSTRIKSSNIPLYVQFYDLLPESPYALRSYWSSASTQSGSGISSSIQNNSTSLAASVHSQIKCAGDV